MTLFTRGEQRLVSLAVYEKEHIIPGHVLSARLTQFQAQIPLWTQFGQMFYATREEPASEAEQ